MSRLDGMEVCRVAMFGGAVFSVGPYTGAVRADKPAKMAAMTDKDRDKAAKWVHGKLVEFDHDRGRTVADVKRQYLSTGESNASG